jgi:hypothetical protein
MLSANQSRVFLLSPALHRNVRKKPGIAPPIGGRSLLASEVSRNADSRLSPIRELQSGSLEYLSETIYSAFAEFFAALKPDNGFRRYLRSSG